MKIKANMLSIVCQLVLASVAVPPLLLAGCGDQNANAVEGQADVVPAKDVVPVKTEPSPIAAQPVVETEQDSPNNDQRLTAIFVTNHADKVHAFDEKLPAFEDFISSRITDKGFSVVSREVATDAVSSLLKDSKQTDIDKALSDNASMLRLAKMLGTDYIIVASITSYGIKSETLPFEKSVKTSHNLRVSYKILDGVRGGTLAGNTFKVSSSTKSSDPSSTESTDTINELLDQAAVLIADSAGKKVIKPIVGPLKLVDFSIACGMQDNAQLPVTVPDIRLSGDNTVTIEKEKLPVLALNVMVELDGAGIGSTPATFKVSPGLHKLRLRRDGFKDYEGTITVNHGQVFNIALQMTDAGYQRWKDNSAFLSSIENGKKLTDAEAEKLRGEAQQFRQSGNLVNIKVDTKENVKLYKSIF